MPTRPVNTTLNNIVAPRPDNICLKFNSRCAHCRRKAQALIEHNLKWGTSGLRVVEHTHPNSALKSQSTRERQVKRCISTI
eukprot:scaffold122877_cov28-Tisochrysis_lutea.AAC.1